MNISDLEKNYLLNFNNQIWLSDELKPAHVVEIATQFAYIRHFSKDPIHLYINSPGGEAIPAASISALIQADGNINGYLIGSAASAGGIVFASCQKRYVYKNAVLGIHSAVGIVETPTMNAHDFKYYLKDITRANHNQCALFAAASNKSCDWWKRTLARIDDMRWFTADELIALGMAEAVDSELEVVEKADRVLG